MKNRTVGIKRIPVVSMAQARRMAKKDPDALVDQIGLLLNERIMLKHERNVLRILMDDIVKATTDDKESKEDLLKRIRRLVTQAMVDKRKTP